MSITTPEKYEIRWIVNPFKKPLNKTSFGYCEKNKRIAMMNIITIDPLMYYQVKITAGNLCEINHACLDVKCPFNKTTKESYAKEYGSVVKDDLETPQQWENLLKHITKFESDLSEHQERLWSGEHHNLMFPEE